MNSQNGNVAEPGDIEVLTFHADNGGELIGVAASPERSDLVSIVGTDQNKKFFHLLLTEKESDLMVAAFQELKRRRNISSPLPTPNRAQGEPATDSAKNGGVH